MNARRTLSPLVPTSQWHSFLNVSNEASPNVITTPPLAIAEMLIRRNLSDVYRALHRPLNHQSVLVFERQRCARNRQVRHMALVLVWRIRGGCGQALEPDRRILILWPTPVEWVFTSKGVDKSASEALAPLLVPGLLDHPKPWLENMIRTKFSIGWSAGTVVSREKHARQRENVKRLHDSSIQLIYSNLNLTEFLSSKACSSCLGLYYLCGQ